MSVDDLNAAVADVASSDAGAASGSGDSSVTLAGQGPSGGTAEPTGTTAPPPEPLTLTPEHLALARSHDEFKPFVSFAEQIKARGGDPMSVLQTLADPDVLAQLGMMQRDLPAFYAMVGDHLRATGQLKADAPPKADPFTMPDADLRAEDGTSAYSAALMAKIIDGLRSDFDQRLEPFKADYETRQAATEQQARYDRASADVKRAAEHIADFASLKDEITRLLREDYQKPREQREYNGNIYAAAHVARKLLGPSLEQSAEAKVKADLQAKAAASAHGTRATGASTVDTKPPKDFLEFAERNPGGAEAILKEIGL